MTSSAATDARLPDRRYRALIDAHFRGDVSPGNERQMRDEAPAVVEGAQVVGADDEQDRRCVARDEIHQAAHEVAPPASSST